ncbi:MAG: TetR/AcrR family transcriptional regulator [Pseudoflavonifractor sp.]
MKDQKDDQRTRMTRRLLQEALVELMREKPLRAVTVKELCARADVNRSTFYLHYYDIYNLMEELEDQIGGELTAALSAIPRLADQDSFSAFYTAIFSLFARHAELCEILLGENGDKAFVDKLFAVGREKCVAEWCRIYPNAPRRRVEFYYVFLSSGCVGLLREWFSGGCKAPAEEVARQVQELVSSTIRTLEE